jgi:hypothetical protein
MVKEHEWLKKAWPVRALLKAAVENRKTHLWQKERKKGEFISPTNPLCQTTADMPFALSGKRTTPSIGLASGNSHLPRNRRRINVATLNGTSDSDTELADTELGGNRSRLGDDSAKSDNTCLKTDNVSKSTATLAKGTSLFLPSYITLV